MIPQFGLFSFIFWRKSKTQKNHFEINLPLNIPTEKFLSKNSSEKDPKHFSQKNPPKTFLQKNPIKELNPPKKSKTFPNNFSENSKDFENIQYPTSHLKARHPFGLVFAVH